MFLKRLQNMSDLERGNIQEFYKTRGQQIVVRSTFEIQEDLRRRIRQAVHDQSAPNQVVQDQAAENAKLQFQLVPDLICGVELSVPDMRIGWSIASYLNALEADLSEALEQKASGETIERRRRRGCKKTLIKNSGKH